jgi:serine/threonine-protein kinase HipA
MGRRSRARALALWINGQRAGEWLIPSRGEPLLKYELAWTQSKEGRPLSLSLPFTLDNAPIKGRPVDLYFDNLLPDSDPIRQRLQARFKTDSRNAFDLLTAIGRDCVGAVQLLQPEDEPPDIEQILATPLTEQEVEATLKQTVAPAALGSTLVDDDFRISIAGAQEKTAFLYHDGRWCRPQGATPTSHIFKLPLGLVGGIQLDMTLSVENEWLCANVLKAYGMPVATCAIQRFGTQKALVVERFDRQLHSTNQYWLRLVQEDFCQATATPSSQKYERDGGPGVDEIGAILRGSSERDRDLRTLMKSQILFWMLAAGDGHAKNFSLRILSQGRYHLTPLYDVLSFFPILGEGPNKISPHNARLAMAIRGKNKHYLFKEIQRRHFTETAKRIGLSEGAESIIEEILRDTPKVISAIQANVPADFPGQVLEPILNGLKSSAKKLEEMKPN